MTRPIRTLRAGCVTCHGTDAHWTGPNAQAVAARHHQRTGHSTWCNLSVRYGSNAGDDRQIDIEDAIASASSGRQAGSRPPYNGTALDVVGGKAS